MDGLCPIALAVLRKAHAGRGRQRDQVRARMDHSYCRNTIATSYRWHRDDAQRNSRNSHRRLRRNTPRQPYGAHQELDRRDPWHHRIETTSLVSEASNSSNGVISVGACRVENEYRRCHGDFDQNRRRTGLMWQRGIVCKWCRMRTRAANGAGGSSRSNRSESTARGRICCVQHGRAAPD